MSMSLAQLTEAKYQKALANHSIWAARETMLRDKLAGLLAQRGVGQGITPHQLSGADIQWHRWLEQRQTALNTELAKCLVQKEKSLASTRKAFLQNEAMRSLCRLEYEKMKDAQAKKIDETAQILGIFSKTAKNF